MSFLEKMIDKVEAKIDKKYSNPYGYQNQGNGAYQQMPNHHGPPPPDGPPPPYQEDNYTGHGMLGMGRSPGAAHHPPPPHHHQRPHSPPHQPHIPHHKPHSPPHSPRRDHHHGAPAHFGPGLVNGPAFAHQPEPGFTGGGLLGKLAGNGMPERRGEHQGMGGRGCGMRGRGGMGLGPFNGRVGMSHRGRHHGHGGPEHHGGPPGDFGRGGGGPGGPGGRGEERW
ncbi:hypothetical protein B0J14DRAFT_110464 [Halenospora varia]|nr:hypothetical protein B0J14DRAFT_110464 [Halenospora varia]